MTHIVPSPAEASVDPAEPAIALKYTLPAVVVHTALRREFRLAGPLVRRVPVGDVPRAKVVARHLDVLLRGLHHHHEIEDEHIWPLLRRRAAEETAPALALMHAQHDEIDRLVQGTALLLTMWSARADEELRNGLAEELGALNALLVDHLEVEERLAFPFAEQYVTGREWRKIGRRSEAGNPGRERALAFGMLQYEGDPEVLASMLASAPLPARLLVPRFARRAYRRHAIAVHGTPTP